MTSRGARGLAAAGVVAWLGLAAQVIAAENLTVDLGGGREISVTTRRAGDVVMADVRMLAQHLDLVVDQHEDRIAIRDAGGIEWRTANGSLLLEGPVTRRVLKSPANVIGAAVYLPLESIADLAGRTVVFEPGRARLVTPGSATVDTRVPVGWQTVRIQKTHTELAEMRRLDGDHTADPAQASVKEVMPAATESMTFDLGLGFAQGMSGAGDVVASGTASGLRIDFSAFVTYGRDGALYRSGRLTVRAPSEAWWLEAGDLLSDVRGLARGVRAGRALRSWWRPSVAMYVRSPTLSATETSAVAYRDELQPSANFGVRGEVTSTRSTFVGVRWLKGRTSLETFVRDEPQRSARDGGVTASYDFWRGVTAQVGTRISSRHDQSRWYFAGLTVPVANLVSLSVERTRSIGTSDAETTALGVQLPLGRVRVMQRYQWTDIGFLHEPALVDAGRRQLQSMASYSPMRRVQLSYQLATQWLPSAEARQWTELQTVFQLSRATSVHAVTGFPDVGNVQRFRFGLQQTLPRRFRLAVDYGSLPAFQSSIHDRAEQSRFLVMVRRTVGVATPAAGVEITGRVVEPGGAGVAGAVVTLGPYVTTARADGDYRFAHVPVGDYDLALDAARLPARYAGDGVKHRLHASSGRNAPIDLHAIPLHAIHGHVYVDRNGNAGFDPGEGVSNVVVRLSGDALATLTDDDGAYGFYDLLPDHYQVRIDVDRLRADLAVASAAAIDVDLDDVGRARTGIDFQVTHRQKPIVIQKILPR